ncbi:MAG: DUF1501 domain-containing protein [Acidimicrobiales bacterium]
MADHDATTMPGSPELSTRAPAMDRRRFLRGLALGGGATVLGGGVLGACGGGRPDTDGSSPWSQLVPADATTPMPAAAGPAGAAALADRTLVLIELRGGNDGLDTLVPVGDPRYLDLRGDLAVAVGDTLAIDDEVGLNPMLAGMHARGIAVVEGVGMVTPDLSHFESSRRWWQGDMTGTGTDDTGFLGRLCDALSGDEPVTGLAIGEASSPYLRSRRAVTLGMTDLHGTGWLSSDDPYVLAARSGLDTMIAAGGSGLDATVRANTARALEFVDVVAGLPEHETDHYPGGYLSESLRACARLLGSGLGVRVLHVAWGDFDTHADHRGNHDYQLQQLDAAVSAFCLDLEDLGLADSTLIATASEFGRRPEANAGGTDHGTASCMLLAGPVAAGRHGEAPSLGDLDDDGNMAATVTMDEYYATLCEEWFGVPTDEVLLAPATPIGGVIA